MSPRFPKQFVPPRLFDRARPVFRFVARAGAVGVLGAALALPAVAQETPPAEAAPAPADRPAVTPGEMLPDGTYVVKTGDTLWDLSQQFLKNPWYWPKIWSENPEIENPHWIYPGNLLKVRGGGEGTPAEVTPVNDEPGDQGGDEPLVSRRREVADFTVGDVNGADDLGAGDDLVSISGNRLAPANGVLGSALPGVIIDKATDPLGEIGASFEPKTMLCTWDQAFLKLKDAGRARVGDRFTVVRDREEVRHPVDGRPVGRYVELIGNVRIVRKESDGFVAVVESCTIDISRGDRIIAGRALFKPVTRKETTKTLAARIIYTHESGASLVASNNVVYIDKGRKDGVADGNVFTVYQFGDGLDRGQPGQGGDKPPRESVGQVIVVDTQESTSAAIVIQSVRDISVGDALELGLPAGTGGDAP